MYQAFYIEPEEEISSIVDRLNKSLQMNNYFVVPKRAIFLQSIVNLKLLKREADKVGKHVVIVTQDEIGMSMAQRSGLEVRNSLDGLEDGQVEKAVINENEDFEYDIPEIISKPSVKKQVRLSSVGTDNFYDSNNNIADNYKNPKPIVRGPKGITVEPIVAVQKNVEPLPLRKGALSNSFDVPMQNKTQSQSNQRRQQMTDGSIYKQKLDIDKERVLEKMYSSGENNSKNQNKEIPTSGHERKIKKIFIGFILLCLISFIGVAAYLFLPSAKIVVQTKILRSKIELDIKAGGTTDNLNIPVRVLDREENLTLPYEIKNGNVASGKKAHGSVVIYNEYDSSPQTLIATTRLETENGKIFRLLRNVVVPGTTTVAGETKPGAITVEIVADQAGIDYNFNSANFSIPGFKDGPKYAKFYAKSTNPIVGGSTSGEASVGGLITISDIENAKQKTEAAIKDKFTKLINDDLKDGEVFLEKTEKITIIKSSANVKVSDLSKNFDYTVTASVKVLIFPENDVKTMMEKSAVEADSSQPLKKELQKLEYSMVDADFDKGILSFKVRGDIVATPIIDKEKLKKELLGKNDKQLAEILKKYPILSSINVDFKPTFISQIPQYDGRVTLEINNTDE